MSIHRFAAKRDISEPSIVQYLEAAGYEVERSTNPDLLVRKGWYPRGLLFGIECKTLTASGKIRVRADQPAQNEFIARGGAVRVATPGEALQALRDFELVISP